jgi:ketosteroid isomerase-like protein
VNNSVEVMALLKQFGKAFNRGDLAAVLECVTEDFEWRLPSGPDAPHGRIVRGKADVAAVLRERQREYRDMRFSETEVFIAGARVFGTYRAQGVHVSGATIDVRGIDAYVMRDGKIAVKDSYWKHIEAGPAAG